MAAVPAVLTAAAVWLVWRPPSLHRLSPRGTAVGTARSARIQLLVGSAPLRFVACGVGCGVACWAVQGLVGALAGGVGGIGLAWWLGRLEPPERARNRELVVRALPLAVDLLAACVCAGQPTLLALDTVCYAVGGPLASRLRAVSARLSLGADPVNAWELLSSDPELAPLARTMRRALESGSPVATGLERLAEDVRRTQRTSRQIQARSVGVRAAGPLALCFLPAFMLIGVVPSVVAAFEHLGW